MSNPLADKVKIDWSEGRFYVLDAINDLKDRRLANDAMLLIFPASWKPDDQNFETIESLILASDGPEEFEGMLELYVATNKKRYPNFLWKTSLTDEEYAEKCNKCLDILSRIFGCSTNIEAARRALLPKEEK